MKKSMIIIGVILGLFFLFVLALPYLLDLNRYRDQYIPLVERVLDRKVGISHVRMMWFPHIGIQIENAKIFDDPNIEQRPFVQASSIEIAVKWIPLLQRRVEIQSLTLHQPTITIIRTKDGNVNASTLGKPKEKEGKRALSDDDSGTSILGMLGVEQLAITDGTLRYEDRAQEHVQRYQLEKIEMKTEAVKLGGIAALSAQGSLVPHQIPFLLKSTLGPLQPNGDIPQIEAQLKFGHSRVSIKGHAIDRKLDLDMTSSKVSLEDLPLNVRIDKPMAATEIVAHIHIPLTETKRAMSSPREITVRPLQFCVELGESRLNISGQAVGEKVELHGTASVIHSTDLPISLPLANPISVDDLNLRAKIDGSLVHIASLTGEIFDGHLEAEGQWNGGGNVPTFQSTGTIQQVNIEKVQKILKPADVALSGAGAMNWSIKGTLPQGELPLLNGQAQLMIRNGQLKGFDLLQRIEEVLKLKKVLSAGQGVTNFSTLAGAVEFQGEQYPIKSIVLEGHEQDFRLEGSGLVSRDQSIKINGDLRLGNNLSEKIVQQLPVAKVAREHGELVVPFAVKGTLFEPKIGIDVRVIQKRLEKQVGKTVKKILQGDPQDMQELLKKGKGLLKSLLGR